MSGAGLTHLSVSIDAADPATHKLLRGGTSLNKVRDNIIAFHRACPEVKMVFRDARVFWNFSGFEFEVAE